MIARAHKCCVRITGQYLESSRDTSQRTGVMYLISNDDDVARKLRKRLVWSGGNDHARYHQAYDAHESLKQVFIADTQPCFVLAHAPTVAAAQDDTGAAG